VQLVAECTYRRTGRINLASTRGPKLIITSRHAQRYQLLRSFEEGTHFLVRHSKHPLLYLLAPLYVAFALCHTHESCDTYQSCPSSPGTLSIYCVTHVSHVARRISRHTCESRHSYGSCYTSESCHTFESCHLSPWMLDTHG